MLCWCAPALIQINVKYKVYKNSLTHAANNKLHAIYPTVGKCVHNNVDLRSDAVIVNSLFYLTYDIWKRSAQRHWTCSVLSHTQRGEQISKHWFTYTGPLSDLNWTMAVLSIALLEDVTYACWMRSKIMHFVCAWVPTECPPLLVYVS